MSREVYWQDLQIILLILFFCGLMTPTNSAQAIESLSLADVLDKRLPHLSNSQRTQVATGERIEKISFKTWQFEFHPDTALKPSLTKDIKELDPSIFVETLQFLPWPKYIYEKEKKADILLKVYNTIRRISTLEGVSYYSASRQKMRTLFVESYTLDKPEAGEKIPDIRVNTIPEYSELYLYQRDFSFGQNVSKGVYQCSDDVISLSFINPFPAIPDMGKLNKAQGKTWKPKTSNPDPYGNPCTFSRYFPPAGLTAIQAKNSIKPE